MIKVGVSNWSSKKSVMKLLRFESHKIMFYCLLWKGPIFEPKKSCIINGLRRHKNCCRSATLAVVRAPKSLSPGGIHFWIRGVAGFMAEWRNVVQEKYTGRGASSRRFVQRIGEISFFFAVQHRCLGKEISLKLVWSIKEMEPAQEEKTNVTTSIVYKDRFRIDITVLIQYYIKCVYYI